MRSTNALLSMFSLSPEEEADLESEVGPKGMWYKKQEFQVNFLLSQGLKPEHSFLDLGCGVLRGGLPLIEYLDVERYTGVEVRRAALEKGAGLVEKFELEHKRPKLICTDDFGVEDINQESQDFIFAHSVLYHLDDTTAKFCLSACRGFLTENGAFFANVQTKGVGRVGKWKEFPFIPRSLETYEEWAKDVGLSCEYLGKSSEFGHITGLGGDENAILLFRRL